MTNTTVINLRNAAGDILEVLPYPKAKRHSVQCAMISKAINARRAKYLDMDRAEIVTGDYSELMIIDAYGLTPAKIVDGKLVSIFSK